MIEKGLLTIISKHLSYNSASLFEHILWSLCNIIGEYEEYKLVLYETGVYDMVLREYNALAKSHTVNKVFAWFISNSLKGKPRLDEEMVI